MKKRLIMMILVFIVLVAGCGQTAGSDDTTQATDETDNQLENISSEEDNGLIQVEIEKIDTTSVQPTKPVEGKNRETVRIAVAGSPATDILNMADESLASSNYSIEAVKCDNYNAPFEMVMSGEALACLSSNQVFLDSYNKMNGSRLTIAERVYIDPLAVFPGKITDLNNVTGGIKVAVSEGDVNVARALYLLEQKGLLEVKEDAMYQASMEDVTSNPHNISIEEVDIASGWPDSSQYGLIICDYNRAILAGIDPETSIGEENRNSKAFDLFTVNLVINNDMAEDLKVGIVRDAINSDLVEEYISNSFYKSVLDYK